MTGRTFTEDTMSFNNNMATVVGNFALMLLLSLLIAIVGVLLYNKNNEVSSSSNAASSRKVSAKRLKIQNKREQSRLQRKPKHCASKTRGEKIKEWKALLFQKQQTDVTFRSMHNQTMAHFTACTLPPRNVKPTYRSANAWYWNMDDEYVIRHSYQWSNRGLKINHMQPQSGGANANVSSSAAGSCCWVLEPEVYDQKHREWNEKQNNSGASSNTNDGDGGDDDRKDSPVDPATIDNADEDISAKQPSENNLRQDEDSIHNNPNNNNNNNNTETNGSKSTKLWLTGKCLYKDMTFYDTFHIDFHNFFLRTRAHYVKAPRPERKPKFTSPSGSEYWEDAEKQGVYRCSDHWSNTCGNIASCWWTYSPHEETKQHNKSNFFARDQLKKLTGYCRYADFENKGQGRGRKIYFWSYLNKNSKNPKMRKKMKYQRNRSGGNANIRRTLVNDRTLPEIMFQPKHGRPNDTSKQNSKGTWINSIVDWMEESAWFLWDATQWILWDEEGLLGLEQWWPSTKNSEETDDELVAEMPP